MANEKRLIDANALMDEFRSYMVERYDREKCVSEEKCKTCDRECLWRRIVNKAPTVDAVEVVHGRWIDDAVEGFSPFTDSPIWIDVIQCSVCKEYIDGSHPENYCPNCGAKMDG